MNVVKVALVFLLVSFFLCTGIVHAEETKAPEPAKAPAKVIDLAQAVTTETDKVAGTEEKKVHTAEIQKGEELRHSEAPNPVSGSASIAFLNRYIFRGYRIGESGLVTQPSLSASYKGFSATLWGNVDWNQRNTTSATFSSEGHKGWNETDLTLSYTYVIKKLSLTGGYIYYDLRYAKETEEFFVSFAYDMLFKPVLSVYQDINAYRGTYFNLSFAHSIPLPKEMSLDLAASFGYEWGQSNYWQTYDTTTASYTGSKYSALHDGMVKAGLTIPVTKAFVVQPMVQYYFALSGDANRTYGTDPNSGLRITYNPNGYVTGSLVYGVNFAYNF